MDDRIAALASRFVDQEAFSSGYSPLYAALFGTVARWLREDSKGPLVTWLLEASAGRPAFDATNLLAAALHRDVLAGVGEVAALAAFYPSAGGEAQALAADGSAVSPNFEAALQQAILTRRDTLKSFIQAATVQTNETGRGFAWLLPLALARWSAVHLVDLGASAGLNLVAEQRRFDLRWSDRARGPLILGAGLTREFVVRSRGTFPDLPPGRLTTPRVLSRTGGDLQPFQLESAEDEHTLASFVWADQTVRLARLREGIAAFHGIQQSRVPVHLHPLRLPEELPRFLRERVPPQPEPVVLYNTYVKMYLPEKGQALRRHIAGWAAEQTRPVLWIQWEPPKFIDFVHEAAPAFGWLAWTVELWAKGEHRQWHLGWVHPHGQEVHWLSAVIDWYRCRSSPS